jgi:hypothetical protein
MKTMTEQPFRLSYHLVIAVAVGLVAPLTGFAWPFAMLTGVVISRDDQDRRRGMQTPPAVRIVRLLAVTGGVLAMLFAGALLGGLIALAIVWLTILSERMTADATPTDRTIARLLLVIGAVVGFVIGFVAFGIRANISIGVGA